MEKRRVEEVGGGYAKVVGEAAKNQQRQEGCDSFHPTVPLDLTKETRREVVEFLEKVEQCGR